MTIKHVERNAINRDGQNGSLLAWIGKILWGKIDAKCETFSIRSHSYNGSTFFANAEIGGIKGKANGSFNSTDKYLSEKFSRSPNRLLSSVESPSHIPTYDNREFWEFTGPNLQKYNRQMECLSRSIRCFQRILYAST